MVEQEDIINNHIILIAPSNKASTARIDKLKMICQYFIKAEQNDINNKPPIPDELLSNFGIMLLQCFKEAQNKELNNVPNITDKLHEYLHKQLWTNM